MEFKIWIGNLGRYNEGALVGEWVSLPISFADFVGVLERIHIDGVRYEEYGIFDYDCDIPGLTDCLGEWENIETLNYLAGKLNEMDKWDLELFEAALQTGEHCGNLAELIELAEGLENFMLLGGVNDYDDLGRYYAEELGTIDFKKGGILEYYFDFERYGRDIALEECGVFTDAGYTCVIDYDYPDFSPDDIPDEYRLHKTEEDEEEEKEEVKHV